MLQSSDTNVELISPSLPKGGGSINGIEGNLASPGSDGMIRFNIPLPITPGRYITPDIALSYSNGSGNGLFGIGWQMNPMSISRRANKGTPKYDLNDEFIGLDGEVLIPEKNKDGNVKTRQTNKYGEISLDEYFYVTRYFPRVESNFDLIEYWTPTNEGKTLPFWLVHSNDGTLHCFGRSDEARIADADDSSKIAKWLLEESLSPFGEHVYYRYKEEDNKGISLEDDNHKYGANRYLKYIYYGNKVPYYSLYIWDKDIPTSDQWLYSIVLDYGENQASIETYPPYENGSDWLLRQDCFSGYEYGFEIRTCRLCRQILMFHNFSEFGEEPSLVWRLQLEYDENPAMSMLSSVQKLAYETDGTIKSIPPQEFDYTRFNIGGNHQWKPFLKIKNQINYQFVDLYGEGIPGLLYQDNKNWYYRSPIRGNNEDDIAYEKWDQISQIPVEAMKGKLLDINGDGRLEWLITKSGVTGSYGMNQDKTWSTFVPIKALPTEFSHPKVQFANIAGSNAVDLVMIGPKSVRFYEGKEHGFKAAVEVLQKEGIYLPIDGLNNKELVAFSDMVGSGQQHLVRIRYNDVTCWPSVGNGTFEKPIVLTGFSIEEKEFDPKRIYLVDIDGSGTSDIVYVTHDELLIYQNLSGNSFADPIRISLPDGVYFDNLCSLIPTDIFGIGITNLILHVPHINPCSWYLDMNLIKPYLLKSTNNNLGASSNFHYRSSAQYWLDEKQKDSSINSKLPFPINIVSRVETINEIDGSSLIQKYNYRRGYYDPIEKEFAGYGYMEVTEQEEDPIGDICSNTSPVINRTWYHTGEKLCEKEVSNEYWQGDNDAFLLKLTRFTVFDPEAKKDVTLESLTDMQEYWLYRSLRGKVLRNENFSIDTFMEVPYTTQNYRYQVRLIQSEDSKSVVLPLQIEELTYNYDQIISDPQCMQQIHQIFDEYGNSMQNVEIKYPRRQNVNEDNYPKTLPESSFSSSYDDQQMILRLSRTRQNVYNLIDTENWRLAIPHQERIDFFNYRDINVFEGIISIESLKEDGTLESSNEEHSYGGQKEIIYIGESIPDLKALTYYTKIAILDKLQLQKVCEDKIDNEKLDSLILSAGYKSEARILGFEDEPEILIAEQGFTSYADEKSFYRIIRQKTSSLTGEHIITWDDKFCVTTSVKDPLDNKIDVEYDYRFLQPIKITDANSNVSEVVFDALGQVIIDRYWGTEGGVITGFVPKLEFSYPDTIDKALSMESILPVSSCYIYDLYSWMGGITFKQVEKATSNDENYWSFLIKNRFITEDGKLRVNGRNKELINKSLPVSIANLLENATRNPVHIAILQADCYPSNQGQQIQASIVFSDGFGRTIQKSQKAEDDKWIIQERVDYDGKEGIIRSFYPFYYSDWKYIYNDIVENLTRVTLHYYDALRREIGTVNAKGYETRNTFYPWFTVNEDENDILANKTQRIRNVGK